MCHMRYLARLFWLISFSLCVSGQVSDFLEKLKLQFLLERRKHKHSLFLRRALKPWPVRLSWQQPCAADPCFSPLSPSPSPSLNQWACHRVRIKYIYFKGPSKQCCLFFSVLQSILFVHQGNGPFGFPRLPVHNRALSYEHRKGMEAQSVNASDRFHVALHQASYPSNWINRLRYF